MYAYLELPNLRERLDVDAAVPTGQTRAQGPLPKRTYAFTVKSARGGACQQEFIEAIGTNAQKAEPAGKPDVSTHVIQVRGKN